MTACHRLTCTKAAEFRMALPGLRRISWFCWKHARELQRQALLRVLARQAGLLAPAPVFPPLVSCAGCGGWIRGGVHQLPACRWHMHQLAEAAAVGVEP